MRTPGIPNRKKLEKLYRAKAAVFEKIIIRLRETLQSDLMHRGLHPTLKSRVKTFDSYYKKILRLLSRSQTRQGTPDVYDVLGIRIVCPFLDDLQIAETCIRQEYDVVQIECKGSEHSFREFGYTATHFLINVPQKMLEQVGEPGPLCCEIQLRTILQDAWSEVEHELVYKTDFSPFDDPMKRKLAALNANLTLSDTLFQEIRDYQRKLQKELNKRRESFMRKVQKPSAPAGTSTQPNTSAADSARTEVRGLPADDLLQKSVDDLLVDALTAHNAGKFRQAIVIYSSVLERDFPMHIKSIIHIHRGMAFFARSHYKKALRDFTTALKLSPDNHRALYYRGLTHAAEQNLPRALADFNVCIAMNPYQFEPLYSRAWVHTMLGDDTSAMADCRLALKIEPESPKAKQLKKIIETRSQVDP